MRPIVGDLFLFEDTCNVYVVRSGPEAVLVDFGSGDVLDHLADIGVERVTDVLVTHYHRDQCQGIARAAASGIRIWVPHVEQDLFQRVDAHWQSREVYNNYNMRQDRFALLEPVRIDGTLQDYEVRSFGDNQFQVVPTPGHTTGSITLLVEMSGQRIAFTGDLIAAPGKVWSMSATQWSYNGLEGVAATIASTLDLKDRQPDLLLPSHGSPIGEPGAAIDLLVSRFSRLLQLRELNPRLFDLRERPYEPITPHLLKHRASMANTYMLLSESGKALVIDFGYDFITGIPSGSDRAARRPWLYTLPALKRQFGVREIDVVIPTHYHDDHVAGFNLLRSVEGTEVWVAESFAAILENPSRYDLPCLWYDPIAVDRRLPLGLPIQWEEYSFSLYPLPGHTRHAVAIYFEVDGKRVLATGDQYQDHDGLELNYVYSNQFQIYDYVASANLYQRLNPDLILSGHWEPLAVTPEYLERLVWMGEELATLHNELLPHDPDLGAEGFVGRLYPYQVTVSDRQPVELEAEIRNPFDCPADAIVQMVVPEGWRVLDARLADRELGLDPAGTVCLELRSLDTHTIVFRVLPPAGFRGRRARVAVDITVNGCRFGQQAEALVSAF